MIPSNNIARNGLTDSQIEGKYQDQKWKLDLFRHWCKKQNEYRLREKQYQIELRLSQIESDFEMSLGDEVLEKLESFKGR